MAVFEVDGVGKIETSALPSGDLKVWHPRSDRLRAVVEPICRGRGYWNGQYQNWIVRAEHADEVLRMLEKRVRRIS